jgi:ribosome biogenesis GTPase A
MLPSTTLDTIEIPLSYDLTFIDTPGIIDNSIENVIDAKTLKRITPKKTIRPITYQIKVNQSIVIEELLQIDIPKDNNITLFFANNLNIMRYYKKHTVNSNLVKHEFVIEKTSDILISGLGFIKVMKPCKLVLYTLDNVEVSLRKALI